MIVPATKVVPPLGTIRKSANLIYVYYAMAILLAYANFVPTHFTKESLHKKSPAISLEVQYWFSGSCILSIPLIFEFVLDFFVSLLYPVFHQNILEHKFGHSFLLLSLALPAILVFSIHSLSEMDSLFGSCFIDCCQALAIFSIYGKLQIFSLGEWNIRNTTIISMIFLGANMFINFAVGECGEESHQQLNQLNVFMALLLTIVCVLLHSWFSRHALHDLYACTFRKKSQESISFTSNQYTCLVLILILYGYFLCRMFFYVDYLGKPRGLQSVLTSHLVLQIVLAVCAAVLPGRMIRRGMVTLKVSFCSSFVCFMCCLVLFEDLARLIVYYGSISTTVV